MQQSRLSTACPGRRRPPLLQWLAAIWGSSVGVAEGTLALRGSPGVLALAAPSGGLGEVAADADVYARERRLEQLVDLQKDVMLQQQTALRGLVLQQGQLSAQEASLAEKLQGVEASSNAWGAAAARQDPVGGAHLDIKTFQDNLKQGQVVKIKPLEGLVACLVYVLFTFIVGYCYGAFCLYEYGPLRRPPNNSGDSFAFGLCDGLTTNICDPDWRICVCSCFCAPVRWADTVGSAKVGFLNFWLAIVLFCVLTCWTGMNFVGLILFLIVTVMARQTIRQRYGLPHGSCGTVSQDCCVWCFCTPCAIMQEALQVEFVPQVDGKGNMQSQLEDFPALEGMPPMHGDPFLTGQDVRPPPQQVAGQAQPGAAGSFPMGGVQVGRRVEVGRPRGPVAAGGAPPLAMGGGR